MIKILLVVAVILATSFWIAKGKKEDKFKLAFVALFYFFGVTSATSYIFDFFVSLFSRFFPQ